MSELKEKVLVPRVMAVVLTWNDYEMAQRCIASLRDNDYPNLEIILVDNGSGFDTVTPLKEAFPELHIVALDKNYGFTGGCNRGMEKALEEGADYVFLLNNDTIVATNAVRELVNEMEERPGAAMASALILNQDENKSIQTYRCNILRDRAWISSHDVNTEWSQEFAKTIETDFAPACAVMFRKAALEEVGLFDESLFTNWEDYDLCIRFADAGWKILVVGKAEVVHAHGMTTGLNSPFIIYYGLRNRFICLIRHGSVGGILRNSFFLVRSLGWRVRSYGWRNWTCHRAAFMAFVHFVFGIRGAGFERLNRDDDVTGRKPAS
ncbi:MAG: glycosyltransferase family 2 protein [Candidatus Hydrogenedentota bacterium]